MRRKIAVGACCTALAFVGAAPAVGSDGAGGAGVQVERGSAKKCDKLIQKWIKASEKGDKKKLKKIEKQIEKAGGCQQSG